MGQSVLTLLHAAKNAFIIVDNTSKSLFLPQPMIGPSGQTDEPDSCTRSNATWCMHPRNSYSSTSDESNIGVQNSLTR